MRKIRVYIAGPITKGDLAHNINQATEAFIQLAHAGFAPWCPHWSVYCKPTDTIAGRVVCYATADGTNRLGREHWMGIDTAFVELCEAVLRLPGESSGADVETDHARIHSIPVFYGIETLVKAFK